MDFLERYKFDFKKDLLGYGGFGEVYKAYDNILNREVALKFYRGSGSSKYDLITEIKKVIRLHHPNLLEFYDASILSQQNAIGQQEDLQVGVMEYANEGDLVDFMETNPTKQEIKIVVLGVLAGLNFMHENGFIHRDLKPQNILFVKKGKRITPKISDFGISKNALGDNSSHSTKLIGTVEYMAPEQFNSKFAINGKPSYNLDLWALGVMLFELLNGKPAFGKRSQEVHTEHLMHNICYEDIPKDIEHIEEPFKSVLQKCLVKDANKRVKSANELIDLITSYKEKTPQVTEKKEVKEPISRDEFIVNLKDELKAEKKKFPIVKIVAGIAILGLLAVGYFVLLPMLTGNNSIDNNTEIAETIPEDTEVDIVDSSMFEEEVADTFMPSDSTVLDSANIIVEEDTLVEEIIEEEIKVEEPVEEPSSEIKNSIAGILNDYYNCSNDAASSNPCINFTARAITSYYGIDDLKRDGALVENTAIFDFVSASENWKSVGMANNQNTLDEAQRLANEGVPVIAINIFDANKLTIPIVAGNQSFSSTWSLNAPAMAAFFPFKSREPIIGKTLNWAWKSPEGIQIWKRE